MDFKKEELKKEIKGGKTKYNIENKEWIKIEEGAWKPTKFAREIS